MKDYSRNMARAQKFTISRWFEFPGILVLLSILVTLTFWVPHIDSFNVSKQSLLVLGTFTLMTVYVSSGRVSNLKVRDPLILLTILFSAILILGLFTAPNLQLAFYGPAGRLTGVLTYLCFTILFLMIALVRSDFATKDILKALIFTGVAQTSYNLIQIAKLDPVDWNNPYGLVLGTLGNSDFTIALTGICWIATFWYLIKCADIKWKIPLACLLVIEIVVMWESQIRQGFVLIAYGFGFIIVNELALRSRRLGISGLVGICGVGTLILLGALQKGPFASFIYKDSVTFRGDYWRAALEMFKDHPLIGVGIGHFGQAFPTYRDALQVSRRGPAFISDQAHSVPLDFLSMGGLLVAIIYLSIIFFVVIQSMKHIKKFGLRNSQDVYILLILFGAYFLQSLISIDQIGLAIWGWVLLGFLANQTRISEPKRKRPVRKAFKKAAPFLVSIFVFIALTPQWNASITLKDAMKVSGNDSTSRVERLKILENINSKFIDSHYYAEAAKILLSNGQIEGIEFAKMALQINANDVDALKYLVIAGKQTQNVQMVETYGKKLKELDPYTDLLE